MGLMDTTTSQIHLFFKLRIGCNHKITEAQVINNKVKMWLYQCVEMVIKLTPAESF